MPNKLENAYGLTILCPLKEVDTNNQSVTIKLKSKLFDFNNVNPSPMSKVPNTYLSRFYILEDVVFEDYPYELEHLKCEYLVFTSNFHGDLDDYLEGMYQNIEPEIKSIWQDCFGFNSDTMNVAGFKTYIKKCQVETTFFFNGSTDEELSEQLKTLYLKQEFSKFVFENAHKEAEELLVSFKSFIDESNPKGAFPTWKPGVNNLDTIIDYGKK